MSRIMALVLLSSCAFAPAHAETVNCTNITSLPATINTQGVYCLKQDLSTGVSVGAAIVITANNVTLDCNGYKVGGLAAGLQTRAFGIYAGNRVNTVVRNCNVRGFHLGILMEGGAGHVVEDNRLDGNTYAGIGVFGSDGDIVRGNYVIDTGGNLPLGNSPNGRAFGIGAQPATSLLVEGNTISNTFATPGSNQPAFGIGLYQTTGVTVNNRVTSVLPDDTANAYGIYLTLAGRQAVRGNTALNATPVLGYGIRAEGGALATCMDNLMIGFATAGLDGCTDGGGNFSN